MLSPDDVLQNRYRIVRQLGKGGMGAVLDTDFVDHSFHAENRSVISDMFLLITHGLMPSQRPKLRPVGTAPRQFWRFVP